MLCILALMREISVLNILRPHQHGPYRLLSILKTAHYNVTVAYPTANAMLGAAVGIDK